MKIFKRAALIALVSVIGILTLAGFSAKAISAHGYGIHNYYENNCNQYADNCDRYANAYNYNQNMNNCDQSCYDYTQCPHDNCVYEHGNAHGHGHGRHHSER